MQDAAPVYFHFTRRREVDDENWRFGTYCNNGWLISTHAPQYMPTFELNKAIVQKAEHYHFDFALSMIKLRGFGGKTQFWDHNLDWFTSDGGAGGRDLAHSIYATAATLTLPPAIVARMAATIDSISGGRFGVNLVTGWQKPEYKADGYLAWR
ncbi:LLM class flavin-dependent oxidoreductase [Escherichia coli]